MSLAQAHNDSREMKNPKFGVTTFAVCVLSAIGITRVILTPRLPASATEKLVTIGLREAPPATTVEVKWKSVSEATFDEARRLRKPMLLLVLDPKDPIARSMEVDVFRDSEVARFVNRNFVGIKVNSDEFPEVDRLILPINRMLAGTRGGLTVAWFDSDGTLIDVLRPTGAGYRPFVPIFMSRLKNARDLIARRQLDAKEKTPAELSIENDDLILQSREILRDDLWQAVTETLKSSSSASLGGIGEAGYVEFRVPALRLLLSLGETQFASDATDKFLRSTGYDPIDGGFYETLESGPNIGTIVSKSAVRNAYAAEYLATLAQVTENPMYRKFAEDCVASIEESFVIGAQLVEGRVSDVELSGLSPRASLTAGKVANVLRQAEHEWVDSHLLREPRSAQLLTKFSDLADIDSPMLVQVRKKLKSSLPRRPQSTRGGRTYITGTVCARLYRVWQLTGSQTALKLAESLWPSIRTAWDGQRVMRGSATDSQIEGWLGTYAGFSDALLQRYICLGNSSDLKILEDVLRATQFQFVNSTTGTLGLCADGQAPIPFLNGGLPEVADTNGESIGSQITRIMWQASYLPVDPQFQIALRNQVADSLAACIGVLNLAKSATSGLFSCHLDFSRDRIIFVPRTELQAATAALPLEVIVPSGNAEFSLLEKGQATKLKSIEELTNELKRRRELAGSKNQP